jgi:hypothetical protein
VGGACAAAGLSNTTGERPLFPAGRDGQLGAGDTGAELRWGSASGGAGADRQAGLRQGLDMRAW